MTAAGPGLDALRDALEGIIPSVIATLDADGMPNISYLSHVHYVDAGHVALSNQFFSKTAANVRRTGRATVMVVDARTGDQFLLDLVFVGARTTGEVFERIAVHLEVMSAAQGMGEVMRLRAVDLYRVAAVTRVVAAEPLEMPPPRPQAPDHLELAARLTALMAAEPDADRLLDLTLDRLVADLGMGNLVVAVPDETGGLLTTIASRGYPQYGVGSEVALGEGVIGVAALRRRVLRIADMRRGQRYVAAVRGAMDRPPMAGIPFPSLAQPQCQLAVPMIAQGRLVGVLFAESAESFAFGHAEEAVLSIVAATLALALDRAEAERGEAPAADVPDPAPAGRRPIRLRYFPRDGSIFIDGDYLIRGVPGRLLHHFVTAYLATGRQDFTNREIRRDAALRLPDFKDNLETRLILLRRRLDEKPGPITLTRPARGAIRLDYAGQPEIEVVVM
ncbi:GAF domain-containing protein [Tistrella mobilis]|uniref:Transcriptional regulator n=1 Tax=Tistrella mobilis TaxID=171437 RepID=A0A162LNX4_9PROT|nr:GAF domain-containing protein [Tistrella mobilis]KYO56048.1 transcriptional regulator [Tistrella mobilis]